MRSTNKAAVSVAAGITLLLAGCASQSPSTASDSPVPVIHVDGTRSTEYESVAELAEDASAIIVATPTGEQWDEPLPSALGGTSESSPTTFVRLKVSKVLSGTLDDDTIAVVSPGIDETQGELALLSGGPYLIFVTPAMYGADQPAGGYAIVGGPAGLYASSGNSFKRVDGESPRLPKELTLSGTSWPKNLKSEKELLHRGP